MANLPEAASWETGIYQLEETDPVQGGPNGIDNTQAKQLANRTVYLKSQIETIGSGKQPLDQTLSAIAALTGIADQMIYFTGQDTVALTPITTFIRTLLNDGDASEARSTLGAISQSQLDAAISALVNSSPATLDTLNELATSLGNDANFSATMLNLLGLKAPIASPVFTGDPKAPTAAQFDNDTSLATTAFVRKSGIQSSDVFAIGFSPFSANESHAGSVLYATNGANVINLPDATTWPSGKSLIIQSAVTAKINRFGTQLIYANSTGQTSLSLGDGDSVTLFAVPMFNGWIAVGNAAQLGNSASFAASLSYSGYQKIPGGFILQWGKVTSSGVLSNNARATLPVAAPNAVLAAFPVIIGNGIGNAYQAQVSDTTQKESIGFTVQMNNQNASGIGVFWFAITF
jgi:hypothetical protein